MDFSRSYFPVTVVAFLVMAASCIKPDNFKCTVNRVLSGGSALLMESFVLEDFEGDVRAKQN